MTEVKMMLADDTGIGKSCFTIRFIQNIFVEEYDPTIEDSYRKQVVIDNQNVMLDLWDTVKDPEYHTFSYGGRGARSMDGFILMYSITDPQSFETAKNVMPEEIQRRLDVDDLGEERAIVIVGNKADLECDRKVPREEGQKLAKKLKAKFMETSAKTGEGVKEAVEAVVRRYWEMRKWREEKRNQKQKKADKGCLIS